MKRRAATDEMRTWLAMLVEIAACVVNRLSEEVGGRLSGRPFCLAALRSADFQ